MPGWHKRILETGRRDEVEVVGIVQEQHPDRTRLFMQWKEMKWPVMIDSFNLLGVSGVPITLLLDEQGIVRTVQPDPEQFEKFLDASFAQEPLPTQSSPASDPDVLPLDVLRANADSGLAEDLLRLADALALWGSESDLDSAIETYREVIRLEPGYGATHFRLGVALRRRFESDRRDPADFENAIESWKSALEIDPNQYIWRRRIQQYGPRLDKPYSFYDWVKTARKEISARGEVPMELQHEPGGAEYAVPEKIFQVSKDGFEEPDPRARILKADQWTVLARSVVVPSTSSGQRAARVHLEFSPNVKRKFHWNNEVEDMVVWVSRLEGVEVDRRFHKIGRPSQSVSQEVRRLEFEVKFSGETLSRNDILPVYALCYICEDVNGTCLYRRVDVPIDLSSILGEE